MAQIYESGKVRTDIPQPTFRANQLANRGLNEQLEKEKQDAFNMYEQGLSIQASESMNTIFQEYGNDPTALSQKLSELNEKMSAEIPDAKMKVNFKTKFIMNSQSLVNKAQANYDKAQFEKKRSSYFNTIYDNNRRISLAFENAFTGNATVDDMVNYQAAINQNKALINTLNEDGTFMFSDAQRLAMSRDVDELATKSFEASLLAMDDDKRAQLLSSLDADEAIIFSAEDEDKNTIQLNLKDAVDDVTYADMKKMAKIADAKIKKQKVAEWNANKSYSAVALMTNPNEQNYRNWLFYNQDASDKKKEAMAKIAGFTPDEEVETTFEGYSDAYDAIKELSNMPNSTMAEKNLIEDKAMEIVQRLHNSNHSVDEEGNIRISSDDLGKSLQMVNNVLSDNVFKKQISELPTINSFTKLMNITQPTDIKPVDVIPGVRKIRGLSRAIDARSKIGKIAQSTMQDIQNVVMSPDMDEADKRKAIHSIYRYGIESAIKARYYWIPDLQNQELVPGETLLNINGRQYLYQGIGDDIFLEVRE